MERRTDTLLWLGGAAVRTHVDAHGLRLRDFPVVLGAAGGPKWLALHGIDRVLAPRLRASGVVHDLVGASIGAWRFAAWAQRDPLRALDALRDAYTEDDAFERHGRDFTATFAGFLARMLDAPNGLDTTNLRIHALVTGLRTAHLPPLAAVGWAALANAVGRPLLERRAATRLLFSSAPSPRLARLPWRAITQRLDGANLETVLMASGAVPGLVAPVRGLHPDPALVGLDGGILDYHFDVAPFAPDFILYPHFQATLTPGWFDRWHRARQRDPRAFDHLLVVAPHPDWVARLPHGRIPDRRDARRLAPAARARAWRTAAAMAAEPGAELAAVLDGQPVRWAD